MTSTITEEQSIAIVQELLTNSGHTTTRTTDPYEKWDLENIEKDIRVEVKCRAMYLDTLIYYSEMDKGLIVEDIKYQALVGHMNLYVNLFETDKGTFVICWDMNKHQSGTSSHLCARNTTFGGYNDKIQKPVHYVKLSNADYCFKYDGQKCVRTTAEEIIKLK